MLWGPLLVSKGIVNGAERIDSYGTIQQLQVVVYGTALTLLSALLIWIVKEVWEARKKKDDKSGDKLDFLINALTRVESRIEHIEKTVVPHEKVIKIIRDEFDFLDRSRQ